MVYFIFSQTYLLICKCRWHAASATLMPLALSKKSHYNAAAWRHNCVAPLSTLIGRLLARNNAPTQWRHVAAAAVVRLIASVTSPRGVKWRTEGAHVNRRWINKDCSARISRVWIIAQRASSSLSLCWSICCRGDASLSLFTTWHDYVINNLLQYCLRALVVWQWLCVYCLLCIGMKVMRQQ